jgi:hypothetical protein
MGGYGSHRVVHSAGARDRERSLDHRRAAEELRLASAPGEPDPGFAARFVARWRERARIAMTPTVTRARRRLADPVCLLNDGTPGRIVRRRIDGIWVEDCVPI